MNYLKEAQYKFFKMSALPGKVKCYSVNWAALNTAKYPSLNLESLQAKCLEQILISNDVIGVNDK